MISLTFDCKIQRYLMYNGKKYRKALNLQIFDIHAWQVTNRAN